MRRLIPILLVIAALLAACGAVQSAGEPGMVPQEAGGPAEMPVAPAPGAGGGRDLADGGGELGYEPSDDDGAAVDGEREVIRTGSMTVEVEDVEAALNEVRDLAEGLDGYVAGARVDGRGESGQLTLRVPSDRFDAAVSALRGVGELVDLVSSEDDVTTELIDLEARLENLRAAEASYRELLDRAVNVEEVLMVQQRLDEIRGQIESLDGQRAYLQRQADMATLSVSLVTPAEPITTQTEDFDPGQIVGEATADLLGLGQAALTGLIYLAILGVPLALIVGIIAVPVWLLRRRGRAATAAEGPAAD